MSFLNFLAAVPEEFGCVENNSSCLSYTILAFVSGCAGGFAFAYTYAGGQWGIAADREGDADDSSEEYTASVNNDCFDEYAAWVGDTVKASAVAATSAYGREEATRCAEEVDSHSAVAEEVVSQVQPVAAARIPASTEFDSARISTPASTEFGSARISTPAELVPAVATALNVISEVDAAPAAVADGGDSLLSASTATEDPFPPCVNTPKEKRMIRLWLRQLKRQETTLSVRDS
jgi:hypothetical protein